MFFYRIRCIPCIMSAEMKACILWYAASFFFWFPQGRVLRSDMRPWYLISECCGRCCLLLRTRYCIFLLVIPQGRWFRSSLEPQYLTSGCFGRMFPSVPPDWILFSFLDLYSFCFDCKISPKMPLFICEGCVFIIGSKTGHVLLCCRLFGRTSGLEAYREKREEKETYFSVILLMDYTLNGKREKNRQIWGERKIWHMAAKQRRKGCSYWLREKGDALLLKGPTWNGCFLLWGESWGRSIVLQRKRRRNLHLRHLTYRLHPK